ncbi:hypothetical protein K450DRAFT_219168 [Umbelopsis ramanniana AG]|uniref:peptidylprolyl isomerase n=1 Tax=Umbelopsis ramanniana AG TaxID=1314678 RepID=A0AAD5HH61_UMBRA|nr:uncharacterized protein K450DRAFT_219168 [Umbelopsis ramanniana AG]KAI8584297.1 hypothetical protein K450DRAFT_219168 [Umbelopsis ramanniana AG]
MKCWSSLILLVTLLATAVLAQRRHPQSPPDVLRIGVLRKPETCKGKVAKGTEVTVHYKAYRWDDEHPFDSTYDEGRTAIKFKQGDKSVIPGLDLGIEGMCIGEARRLLIPANLAYGEMGLPGTIEAGTHLMYEVELIHSTTTFTNPWFWAGLAVLVSMYLIFDRMAKNVEASKAANFIEKKQESKQTTTSSEGIVEPSDKKND